MNIRAVGQWMGNHKFWSSVIMLFAVITVLGSFNLLNTYGTGRLLGIYILFGGLIWSIQAKKKGLTLITMGAVFAPVAILLWWFVVEASSVVAVVFAVLFTFLSGLFMLIGIGRYRRISKKVETGKSANEQFKEEQANVEE
jgi:hypothetical protein